MSNLDTFIWMRKKQYDIYLYKIQKQYYHFFNWKINDIFQIFNAKCCYIY